MKRKRFKSQPLYIKKLIKESGVEYAADAIGITASALKKISESDEVEKSKELAAQLVYEHAVKNKSNTAIIDVDPKMLDFIKQIVEASDGDFKVLN